MKFSMLLRLSTLFLFFVLFGMSCSDPCAEIVCNGGVCNDGTCICPEGFFGTNCEVACINGAYLNGTCNCLEGYEGDACDVESRVKFYGTWEGTLSGCSIDIPIAGEFDIPDLPISMEISENAADVTTVTVMLGMDDGTAEIDGDEIILNPTTMQFEAMGVPVTVTISGTGELTSDTRVEMDLDLEVLGASTQCPLTLTKV